MKITKFNFENLKKFILVLISVLFIIQLVFLSLGKGGGWDLGQQIAMADRVLNSELLYTSPQDGFYLSNSPYFPGVSFLSTLVSQFSFENRETILLLIATSIGIGLLFSLTLLSKQMGVKFQDAYLIILLYGVWFFNSWKAYMTEFKPDSIVLLAALAVFYLLIKLERRHNSFLCFFCIFLLLLLIGVFKQQGIAIFIGTMLFVLFTNSFNRRTKILLFSVIVLGGLSVLGIVFSIPNCIENTVVVLSRHPLMTSREILSMFLNSFERMWIFYVPFGLYFLNLLFKRRIELQRNEREWLFFAIPWLFFSLLSAIKVGGNEGNIEVAFLPFLPYNVVFLNRIVEKSKEFKYILYFCLLLTFYSILFKTKNEYKHWKKYKQEQTEIIAFLSSNFANKTVLYAGDDYMTISKANLKHKSEFDTATGFGLGKYDLTLFYRAIENQEYDLIYCSIPLDLYEDKKITDVVKNAYISLPLKEKNNPINGKIYILRR